MKPFTPNTVCQWLHSVFLVLTLLSVETMSLASWLSANLSLSPFNQQSTNSNTASQWLRCIQWRPHFAATVGVSPVSCCVAVVLSREVRCSVNRMKANGSGLPLSQVHNTFEDKLWPANQMRYKTGIKALWCKLLPGEMSSSYPVQYSRQVNYERARLGQALIKGHLQLNFTNMLKCLKQRSVSKNKSGFIVNIQNQTTEGSCFYGVQRPALVSNHD